MLPNYNTKKFRDIYPDINLFVKEISENDLSKNILTEENTKKLYCLLYAKYGNSNIANLDESQFKFKLYSIIFESGGNWQKKLQIQNTLRSLTDDQIMQGTKIIANHAMNPATDPSTASLDELTYIDAQNTTNYRKGAVEAFGQYWAMLDDNLTQIFLSKFAELFNQFVLNYVDNIYITTEEEN